MNYYTSHDDPVSNNNQAITLMESGCLEDAIHVLSQALETTKKVLLAISDDDQCAGESSDDTFNFDLNMNMRSTASIIPEQSLSQIVARDEEQAYYYIYCKGIRIEPMSTTTSSSLSWSLSSGTQRRMVIYSTIIVFNLALAFHLSALAISSRSQKNKNKTTARLTKALKLYELALTLQDQGQIQGNVFFTLATVNNMGMIQRSIGESDKQARGYFEFLLSNLLPVFAGIGKERNVCPLTAFFHNAITILNSRSHSAPAA